VRADGGFGHVSADVGLCVAADADLGGVVIAPESGILGAECAVAVVHIIGLARHRDVHSAAVASAAVRGGEDGWIGHVRSLTSHPSNAKPLYRSVYPAIPVWVGIEP
jgi:hypothetical protein